MGLSWSFGFTMSVAPNFSAIANLLGLVSMPMMRFAPDMRAPMMAAKPMPPKPKIATVSPRFTLAVFITAPMPVVTPQPSKHTSFKSASGWIFANDTSATTVYSEKVEQPM